MSWTFIGMLLLVVGLIAANLALLKHGSKKNQRPLKNNRSENKTQHQQKVQAAAATAPVAVQDSTKTTASNETGHKAAERAEKTEAEQQNSSVSGNDESQA